LHLLSQDIINRSNQYRISTSQMTVRIDHQAAVVDTTNVIHALNTSAYHNSSAEWHQLPSRDYCYTDHTLASHTVSFLSQ